MFKLTDRFLPGRCFHSEFISKRERGRAPGSSNESLAVGNAINRIGLLFDKPGHAAPVVVEVANAALVGAGVGPNSSVRSDQAGRWLRKASFRIKCLTNADKLSDAALAHQIEAAEKEHPGTAVFALNLAGAGKIKSKELKQIKQAIVTAGAAMLEVQSVTTVAKVVVCGSPNAGKSSLILPLTKARTLTVRNKQAYHLPSVSAKAGQALGVKDHVLQVS